MPHGDATGAPWDIIAISSGRRSDTTFFYQQLERKRETCPKWAAALGIGLKTLMVPVPDPFTEDGSRAVTQVGSGGAALNAVLHVAEQISARRDAQSICGNAFADMRVVVLLCGISRCGAGGSELGKAFTPLPLGPDTALSSGGVCNAELALLNLQRIATPAPALWVCSTEWLMHIPPNFPSPFESVPVKGFTALALPSDAAAADTHGLYALGPDGQVADVVYRPGRAAAERDGLLHNSRVLVIAPITRLSADAADALLSLHNQSPFDACTYYGSDSSSTPVPINFYLDFLLACSAARDRYVSGTHANATGALRTALPPRARAALAKVFEKHPIHAACPGFPPYLHEYPTDARGWLASCRRLHTAVQRDPQLNGPDGSRRPSTCRVSADAVVFRSWLDDNCKVGAGSLVLCARLGRGCVIGERCRVYHLALPAGTVIPDDTHVGAATSAQELEALGISANAATSLLTDAEQARVTADTAHIFDDEERRIWLVGLTEERANMKLSDKLDLYAVRNVLLSETDALLTAQLGRLATSSVTPITAVLAHMDGILAEVADRGLARVLSCMADFIAACARGRGGVRSGPARNPRWLAAFAAMQKWDGSLEGRRVWIDLLADERKRWLGSPESLIRAARHFEGAAAVITARCVDTASQFIHYTPAADTPAVNQWVKVTAPARLDIAGGWTDTPPVSYETGGLVVNVAVKINGVHPLQACCRRLADPELRLWVEGGMVLVREIAELMDYSAPQAPAAIMKAALIALDVISVTSGVPLAEQLRALGGGLEMQIMSTLPMGSGLGGSSILGGVLLKAIGTVVGRDYSRDALVHAVLRLEQILTSGGGWQDQAGGLHGGIKTCHSAPQLPLKVTVDPLKTAPEFLQRLSRHIVLVYSGRARLARNLLQSVLRRWASRLPDVVDTVRELRATAAATVRAIAQENIPAIGRHLMDYWRQKQNMAGPGAEPIAVGQVVALWSKHIHGYTLGGAGGGGFIIVVTKEPDMKDALKSMALAHCEAAAHMQFYDVTIDPEGLTVDANVRSPSSANTSFDSIPAGVVESTQAALGRFAQANA